VNISNLKKNDSQNWQRKSLALNLKAKMEKNTVTVTKNKQFFLDLPFSPFSAKTRKYKNCNKNITSSLPKKIFKIKKNSKKSNNNSKKLKKKYDFIFAGYKYSFLHQNNFFV